MIDIIVNIFQIGLGVYLYFVGQGKISVSKSKEKEKIWMSKYGKYVQYLGVFLVAVFSMKLIKSLL